MGGKWKHGYIPEDMTAALEKAHGSKTGASKALTSGKRSAKPTPKSAPRVKNPGGRNMQDLRVPKDIKKKKTGIVSLGKLPPGFGKNK